MNFATTVQCGHRVAPSMYGEIFHHQNKNQQKWIADTNFGDDTDSPEWDAIRSIPVGTLDEVRRGILQMVDAHPSLFVIKTDYFANWSVPKDSAVSWEHVK